GGVVLRMGDGVEARHAMALAGYRLAVDDAGSRAQPSHGFDNQGKTVGEIVAGAAVEPHTVAVLASDNAKSVVLDLVQPSLAGWRLLGFGGKARRGENSADKEH